MKSNTTYGRDRFQAGESFRTDAETLVESAGQSQHWEYGLFIEDVCVILQFDSCCHNSDKFALLELLLSQNKVVPSFSWPPRSVQKLWNAFHGERILCFIAFSFFREQSSQNKQFLNFQRVVPFPYCFFANLSIQMDVSKLS